MEWMEKAFLLLIGLCAGGVVASGLFSFIVSIGVMTRIIGKTHTGNRTRLYENGIAVGITVGNLMNLYEPGVAAWVPAWISFPALALFGLCAGVFVGVLVMSLAETLNALPVFTRKLKMTEGMKYIIVSLAAGKGVGALLDFWMKIK